MSIVEPVPPRAPPAFASPSSEESGRIARPTPVYNSSSASQRASSHHSQSSHELHAHFELPPGEPKHDIPVLDIEHVPVDNDPREWSTKKKTTVLYMIAVASLAPTLATSIFNPAFDQLRSELGANDTQISLCVSLYILLQGWFPIMYTSVAELIGRKRIYIVSYALFFTGSIVASRAQSMQVLIGMRVLQAAGSSAVMAIGAGSLADMYDQHERGTKIGIYYGLPLTGPALGGLIGGILSNAFTWRSTFYFIAVFAFIILCLFAFFPDSWRRERSKLYQNALKAAIKRAIHQDEVNERKRKRKLARGLDSTAATPAPTQPATPGHATPEISREVDVDLEHNQVAVTRKRQWPWSKRQTETADSEHADIKLSIKDVNPFPPMWAVLHGRLDNIVVMLSSGVLFASQYCFPFTAAVTFAEAPYNYNALHVGLVLLAFGLGNIAGSVLGGRYSDKVLARLKKANGGKSEPEFRLKSTIGPACIMIPAMFAYAWTADKKTHIAGPVVSLFVCGMTQMVVYSSALAYVVDANPGRSSTAFACNSFSRGTMAFVASQVALPIRRAIGDGGLYSILAGMTALSCSSYVLVMYKGKGWREPKLRRASEKEALERQAGSASATMVSSQIEKPTEAAK